MEVALSQSFCDDFFFSITAIGTILANVSHVAKPRHWSRKAILPKIMLCSIRNVILQDSEKVEPIF